MFRGPLKAGLVALSLIFVVQPVSGSVPGAGDPVVGGASASYNPGALVGGVVVPSAPVEYQGEPLTVAATYVGRDAGEPTLSVAKDGTAYIAAAAYDGVAGLPRTRVLRSDDGGKSWKDKGPKVPGGDNTMPPVTVDPYVWVDTTTGRVFNVELSLACSTVSISDDRGESWISNPLGCGQPVNDHQTIVTGPPAPPLVGVGYPNAAYYCFNRVSDAACSRSLDGGLNWVPSGAPSFPGYEVGQPYNKFGVPGLCGGLHGHAVVDKRGWLYIPKSHCGLPTLAVSEDNGVTWRRSVVSTAFKTGEAHVGEHHSVAVDDAGNVYYLFYEDTGRLPWLAVSRDGGKTFGAPMMVAPPGVTEVNLAAMDAGAAGRVAIQFAGSTSTNRNDAKRPWNSYMLVTTNALDEKPLFLSTTANPLSDPIHRGNCHGRCGGMLDFLDMIVSPVDGRFWAPVVDTCTAGNKCSTTGAGTANDAEGIAVRQLTGPRLREPAPAPAG